MYLWEINSKYKELPKDFYTPEENKEMERRWYWEVYIPTFERKEEQPDIAGSEI